VINNLFVNVLILLRSYCHNILGITNMITNGQLILFNVNQLICFR